MTPEHDIPPTEHRINEYLNSDKDFLFVVESDQQLFGSIALSIVPNGAYGELYYGTIENFIVFKQKRKKGLGKSLIENVISTCLKNHCNKIMTLTFASSTEAQNMLSSYGFETIGSKGMKKYLPF